MKNYIVVAAALLISVTTAQAQENVDVTKETTIKKVRVSDDKVETVVVKETDVKKEALVIPKENVKEQKAVRVSVKDNVDSKVVKNTVTTDPANDAQIAKNKAKQKKELKSSIEKEKKKTKKATKEMIDNKM